MIETILTNRDLANQELINEISEVVNPVFEVEEDKPLPGEERGAWLTRCLGLDKVKKVRYRSSGYKKVLDDEVVRRKELEIAYDAAKNKVWTFNEEDFTIDPKFNFTHATWKGTYCKGGESLVDTIEIINRYIDECQKPYGKRNLSFIHIVKD